MPLPPETHIGHAMNAELEARAFSTRSELVVTIDGCDHYADVAGVDSDGHYVVIECKRRLSGDLVNQCVRWRRRAHQVYAAVSEPHQRTKPHEILREVLQRNGVGLFYVTDGGAAVRQLAAQFTEGADVRALGEAFVNQTVQAPSPPAGSANSGGVKRITRSRGRWQPVTDWVNENPGFPWKLIRKTLGGEWKRVTPAKAREAVDRGEWLGVRYDGDVFYPDNEETS